MQNITYWYILKMYSYIMQSSSIMNLARMERFHRENLQNNYECISV